MAGEVLVKVEGLSKKFCKDLKTSLWYGVKDLFSGITGNHNDGTLRKKEFWAIRDISFELRRGECLGLIGHNGAGKSTLLKILNGLINPDEGKITMRGRVGALIELGAGFNLILTGRENIYNNGAVLGFSRKEIDAKVEEIIDFSEIREFIDMPVQNYSSGMKVRLGFAVASQMEPDVLIVDEVLAVGDVGFTTKCLNKISELTATCAVIFVSHSMPMVGKICTEAILMNRGIMKAKSKNISEIIQTYFAEFKNAKQHTAQYDSSTQLGKIELIGDYKTQESQVSNYLSDIKINYKINTSSDADLYIAFLVFDQNLRSVTAINSIEDLPVLKTDGSSIDGVLNFQNNFTAGKYTISMEVYELTPHKKLGKKLIHANHISEFVSIGVGVTMYCPVIQKGDWILNQD
jgi:lipopolysaccharide transport system ATP-binding protein